MAFLLNGFSLGQDFDLTIRDDKNVVINWFLLGHGMDFEANSDDKLLSVTPVTAGGMPIFERIPGGWSGRMMFTRVGGEITDMFAAMDFNFYNFARRPKFTLNARIFNRSGTTSSYTLTQTVLHKGGTGNFKADKEVDQTISFSSQQLLNTGNTSAPLVGYGP